MKAVSKEQLYDFFILACRCWLGYMLIHYGWGKLTGNQFGVSDAEMNTALKDLNLFRLSWFLADHEPFKSFVGVTQIVTGVLLIFRKTCIIGAFMSIPIWLNILVWDLTFLQAFGNAFTIRLSYYLLLTGLILYHYRVRVFPLLRCSIQTRSGFSYPFWAYLLLPVAGFIIEFIPGIPRIIMVLTGRIQ
jgi:uncharacterized membrane protein YphA (DoxX/SURF4 family)